jgi:hypothetical protein
VCLFGGWSRFGGEDELVLCQLMSIEMMKSDECGEVMDGIVKDWDA